MAYVVKSYGSGALGNVTAPATVVNSYAQVTAYTATTVTFNSTTKVTGTAGFTSGARVLIHVSASTGTSYKLYLGRYLLTTVTSVSGSTLTIADDFTAVLPTDEFSRYYVQVIAVAQYKNLTLSTGTTISPPVYSASTYCGGIVAIMCSETLTFSGGHISLADRGIPVANKTLRPTTNYDVALDTANYAGWENSATKDYFVLNAGDGAAFIIAKTMVCNTSSRIGNVNTYGVQFYRGSSQSVTCNESAPSSVTNVGGSTILVAAETITDFTPRMFAKYRASDSTAGQGICRCYIASETKLRNDEGLYAYDCISNPTRLSRAINFKDFGDGSIGDVTNPTSQLNNYATITAITGNKVTYKDKTTAGMAPISAGALVMIHFNHKDSTNVVEAGRFVLAKVLNDNGTVLTLDTVPPAISVTDYAAQVVSIPQFNNFTLSTTNSATPAFSGAQGGICAIAAKGTCNLSGGKLDVRVKGGGKAYARAGLAVIGNAQDSNKLPIGQGMGSVLVLAQNLTMNSSTRIGNIGNGDGGYKMRYLYPSGDIYSSGASGGYVKLSYNNKENGYCQSGYGSAGYRNYPPSVTPITRGHQGAHVMIVADTIINYTLAAISTGGGGESITDQNPNAPAGSGGAYRFWVEGTGYYNAGKSTGDVHGSSGWAFVYCNNVVNQDTSGTILTP